MAPIRGLEDMERMESIDFKAITAEVATKKASVIEIPEVVETGRSSSAVPVSIIERKPVVRSTDGGVFLIFLLKLFRPM